MWTSMLGVATALHCVAIASATGGITELTGSTLAPFIADNEFVFVEFYAPWCGHCKNLVPIYAKLPEAIKVLEQDVKVAKIDAAEYKEETRDYGIKGFPALRLFVGGSMAVLELKEMPTPESLTAWVKKKLEPSFVELDNEADVQAHTDSGISLVGFSSETGEAASSFATAFGGAARSIDDYPVALVSGASAASIAKAVGVTGDLPATAIFTKGSKFAKEVTLYEGDLKNTTTFLDFVATATTPLVEGWGTYGRKLMKGAGPPIAVLVFADSASDTVWDLARATIGDVAVVQVDISGPRANAKLLEAFGSGPEQEAVTIVRVKGMTKFKYPKTTIDSVDNVKAYIADIVDGTIKPTLKSAAPPATPTVNGLTTIVGTTFASVALDSTKHALVEFYAPWCGHCKNLVPVYEKVAKHFEATDSVVVAKCDATANEVDGIYVKSFPTIKYFGPDNLEQDYSGGRTAEDFIAFLAEKSGAPATPRSSSVEVRADGSMAPEQGTLPASSAKKSVMPQASVEMARKFIDTFKYLVVFIFDSSKLSEGSYEMDVAYAVQAKLKESSTPVLCIQIDANQHPSVKDFVDYDTSQPAMMFIRDGVINGAVPLGDDVSRIMGAVVTGVIGSFKRMSNSQDLSEFMELDGKSLALVGPSANFGDVKGILSLLHGVNVGIALFSPDFIRPSVSTSAAIVLDNGQLVARFDAPIDEQEVLKALRTPSKRSPIARTTTLNLGNAIQKILLNKMRAKDSARPYHAYFVGEKNVKFASQVTSELGSAFTIVVTVPDEKSLLDTVIQLCDGELHDVFIWNAKDKTATAYDGEPTVAAFRKFHNELLGVNTGAAKQEQSKARKVNAAENDQDTFKAMQMAGGLTSADRQAVNAITELTGSTLAPFIADNEFVFVEFYAPWCGHCKNLVPIYAKLPEAIKVLEQDVKVAKIDAAEYKEETRDYGIKGFPALRLFVGGSMAVLELKEMPTPESLTAWVKKKLEPSFVELDNEADVQAHTDSGISLVGFSSETGEAASSFATAFGGAARSIDDYPVALVSGASAASIAKAVGVTGDLPATAIFTKGSKFAKEVTLYEGDLKNTTTFLDFVATATTPLVEGWGTYGRKLMKGAGPPIAVLVFADSASDTVWDLARATTGDVAVVQVDISGPRANAKLLEAFGSGPEQEAVTIVRVKGMTKFKYPKTTIDSVDNVKAYIADIVDGTIKPTLKSAAPPATPTVNGLTTIVGTTFASVALDSTKHALVEFYAPWCGHCKNLVPVYEKVAKHFEATDSVVVAKCDATANEVDGIYVKSFPTIKYFGPDNLEQDYSGGRTAEDFIAFLAEKNSQPPQAVQASAVDGLYTFTPETFADLVFDKSKHSLVFFVEPDCSACKKFLYAIAELAKHYENNPNVVIATGDGSLIKHRFVKLKSFPSLMYYGPNNFQEGYKGHIDLNAFVGFLEGKMGNA